MFFAEQANDIIKKFLCPERGADAMLKELDAEQKLKDFERQSYRWLEPDFARPHPRARPRRTLVNPRRFADHRA